MQISLCSLHSSLIFFPGFCTVYQINYHYIMTQNKPEGRITNLLETEFRWDIDFSVVDFSTIQHVESPFFVTVKGSFVSNWKLVIYPRNGTIHLHLSHSASFTPGLLNSGVGSLVKHHFLFLQEGVRTNIYKSSDFMQFYPSQDIKEYGAFTPEDLLLKGIKGYGAFTPEDLSLKGTKTIFCRMLFKGSNYYELETSYQSDALDSFETLINESKFSDVIFLFDDKKLAAHKCMLAVRSKVFAAMFEHGMKENRLSEVKIDDIDYDVFKEVLRFIYCGRVENLENIGKELLIVAEKYALDSLKNICDKYLSQTLTINNVSERLQIAFMYNADKLKHSSVIFISSKGDKVIDKIEFKQSLEVLPKCIYLEIIQALILRSSKYYRDLTE